MGWVPLRRCAWYGVAWLAIGGLAIGDGGANHRVRQTRPVQLGTSMGNDNDINLFWCCSGTGGSLVQKNGEQYILSNNHVFAKSNSASIGDDISQPGLIDKGCTRPAADVVADLSQFVTIQFGNKRNKPVNAVDAAIAKVWEGQVDATGAILDIGTVCSSIRPADASLLGASVKKSGRTSGLTVGTVAAIGVTVDVSGYGPCGTGSKTARFGNQIRISGGLSQGGDSGSLVVENVTTSPRPVGLLFAGSTSGDTWANTAQAVTSAFGVSFVGGTCSSSTTSGGATTTSTGGPPGRPSFVDQLLAAVAAVKSRHEAALFNVPETVGTGIGLSQPGELVIEVYVRQANENARRNIPAALEGVRVQIVETGEVTALPACSPCASAAKNKKSACN